MAEQFIFYMHYPFVWYALITGTLIALCSAFLGVPLVLRHHSFIGDGLSRVSFGAMALAGILGISSKMAVTIPITVLFAVALMVPKKKPASDVHIAAVSASALAIGYILMNLFPNSANVSGDVCSILFGSTSILTLGPDEVILSVVLSMVTVACSLFFYGQIFSVTFDGPFAMASGLKIRACEVLMAVVTAVVVVLSMKLVGSLLIPAFIVFPALSAMQVTGSYKRTTIFAAAFSVACSVAGIITAVLVGTPVGSTIVGADVVAFPICFITGAIKGGK